MIKAVDQSVYLCFYCNLGYKPLLGYICLWSSLWQTLWFQCLFQRRQSATLMIRRDNKWLINKAAVLTDIQQPGKAVFRMGGNYPPPIPFLPPSALPSRPCGFCWTHFQIWKWTVSGGGGRCTRLAHSTRRAEPRRWSPYKETRDTKFAGADFSTRHLVEGREKDTQRGSVLRMRGSGRLPGSGKMKENNEPSLRRLKWCCPL